MTNLHYDNFQTLNLHPDLIAPNITYNIDRCLVRR
jgi:hypothetical protein